jgi:hypothetical protein
MMSVVPIRPDPYGLYDQAIQAILDGAWLSDIAADRLASLLVCQPALAIRLGDAARSARDAMGAGAARR